MRRGIIILSIITIITISLLVWVHYDKQKQLSWQVTFLDVGQGDAALIRFSDGQKMLVDCGLDRKILSALGAALPFYERELDYLLITHPDNDHYGGCLDILKRYQVKKIITNGEEKKDDIFWEVWSEEVKNSGAILENIIEPTIWQISDSILHFYTPDNNLELENKQKTGNNNSIVFRLSHKDKNILFMGDAEIPLEDALLKKYCSSSRICRDLASDIIKIGHHGSDSSSGERFLVAVGPKQAIISVGKNTFGHPSLRVLRHLQRLSTEILRTDERNDIIIK